MTRTLTAPTVGLVARGLLRYAVLPGLVVWFAVTGLGLLIMGPLANLPAESVVNIDLAQSRSPLMNTVTDYWSTINDTWWTIGLATAFAVLLLVLTRRWWTAIVPLAAITVEATIFVTATTLIGRPRPEVSRLDPAPPTSSYPSGHTAAACALWLSLALLAVRIQHAVLRRCLVSVLVIIPFLVAYARLYRGMHHLSDVIIGAALGIFCAFAVVGGVRWAERVARHDDPARA